MPNEDGVMTSDSPNDEEILESQVPPDEGQSPSKANGKGLSEEARALLQKKDKAIEELRAKYEALEESRLEEKEERLQELQEKSRLSAADREEMETLEDQIVSIKKDPKAKPWLKINEDQAVKAAKREKAVLEAELTEDYVSEIAEKENIPFEKFEREIVKFMRRVDPGAEMNTLRRAKKAYKLYQEEQSYSKRELALKEKEKQFAETGGARPPRPQGRTETMESFQKSDSAKMDILKAIAKGQEEATSR